jgi:hypothetical protein
VSPYASKIWLLGFGDPQRRVNLDVKPGFAFTPPLWTHERTQRSNGADCREQNKAYNEKECAFHVMYRKRDHSLTSLRLNSTTLPILPAAFTNPRIFSVFLRHNGVAKRARSHPDLKVSLIRSVGILRDRGGRKGRHCFSISINICCQHYLSNHSINNRTFGGTRSVLERSPYYNSEQAVVVMKRYVEAKKDSRERWLKNCD